MAISRSANRRAFSTSVVCCALATSWATRFQTWWLVSGSRQSIATWLWSAVRVVLFTLPIALVSLKAVAYSLLVSAGGGGGANWEGPLVVHGVTDGTCALVAGVKSGKVGCHWPGALLAGV